MPSLNSPPSCVSTTYYTTIQNIKDKFTEKLFLNRIVVYQVFALKIRLFLQSRYTLVKIKRVGHAAAVTISLVSPVEVGGWIMTEQDYARGVRAGGHYLDDGTWLTWAELTRRLTRPSGIESLASGRSIRWDYWVEGENIRNIQSNYSVSIVYCKKILYGDRLWWAGVRDPYHKAYLDFVRRFGRGS